MEDASLAGWRKELLSAISGDVIEIGSGTGVNLQYYSDRVKSVTLTEPDRHMCDILQARLCDLDDDRFCMLQASADNLRFDDGSFDAAVVTLVLCSVDDQLQVLEEIKCVLRPGGKIFFIEHVLAKHEPKLIKWQKLLQPVWVCACGSCHLTRDTGNSIAEAGFRIERLENRMSSGCPAVVAPCISGIAIAA
jgi:ubiquinone/menaquinone biosynthesis C-methylase UbiE